MSHLFLNMKYLIIGPGGIGIFSILGAIEPIFEDIGEISGSSAGSIIAFMWGIGMKYDQMIRVCMSIDLTKLTSANIYNFISKYGMVDHKDIKTTLLKITDNIDIKFKDIDKNIYIAAYDVNEMKTKYFSKYSTPNLSIIDAVCMSISIPFIFNPFEYKGHLYIDGAIEEDLPAEPFILKNLNDIIVISVICDRSYNKISNMFDYIKTMCLITLQTRYTWKLDFGKVIRIDLSGVNLFNFNLTDEEKLKLLIKGKKCT